MTKLNRIRILTAALAALLAVAPAPATPAPVGKTIGKAAVARLFRQDLKNHAVTAARPLTKPRTVHRYTSTHQASREVRKGLTPNTHMTATARRGRPLSAGAALNRLSVSASRPPALTANQAAGWSEKSRSVGGAALSAAHSSAIRARARSRAPRPSTGPSNSRPRVQ